VIELIENKAVRIKLYMQLFFVFHYFFIYVLFFTLFSILFFTLSILFFVIFRIISIYRKNNKRNSNKRKRKKYYKSKRRKYTIKRRKCKLANTFNFSIITRPDRITFLVPSQKWSDLKPKVGDIVTFSYEAYSVNSIPTNPAIIRIRSDLSWESIVREHRESSRQSQFLNGIVFLP
jgi:hypothetical protein